MSLADRLGYRLRPPNPVQRAAQAVGSTWAGAWVLARTLPHLDTWVQGMTRGRHTLPGLLAGLPVVQLTTTGRRSGQPRTTHLIAVPHGDGLAVIGTNFGQRATPAWALNLEVRQVATVSYRDASATVRARALAGPERDAVLSAAARIYAGYAAYQRRITGRQVRVFVLEES